MSNFEIIDGTFADIPEFVLEKYTRSAYHMSPMRMRKYQYLICKIDNQIVGFAGFSLWKLDNTKDGKQAYCITVQEVYVGEKARGNSIAFNFFLTLFERFKTSDEIRRLDVDQMQPSFFNITLPKILEYLKDNSKGIKYDVRLDEDYGQCLEISKEK